MAQIKISGDSHHMLHKLARIEGVSMQVVLDKALAEYQKNRFFDSLDAAFGTLKNDSQAWAEEQPQRQTWAMTLSGWR